MATPLRSGRIGWDRWQEYQGGGVLTGFRLIILNTPVLSTVLSTGVMPVGPPLGWCCVTGQVTVMPWERRTAHDCMTKFYKRSSSAM